MSVKYCVVEDENGQRYVAVLFQDKNQFGDGRFSINDQRLPASVRNSEPGLCYSESGGLLK